MPTALAQKGSVLQLPLLQGSIRAACDAQGASTARGKYLREGHCLSSEHACYFMVFLEFGRRHSSSKGFRTLGTCTMWELEVEKMQDLKEKEVIQEVSPRLHPALLKST